MKDQTGIQVRARLMSLRKELASCLEIIDKATVNRTDPFVGWGQVIGVVAAMYSISPQALTHGGNTRGIVLPRQIAQYLMHSLLGMSYPAIGRVTGERHHTTVLHACRKVQRLREDAAFADRLAQIENNIEHGNWGAH